VEAAGLPYPAIVHYISSSQYAERSATCAERAAVAQKEIAQESAR
jgi:hypothetical protein